MDTRKKNVDIIRAMALLLVVVYHAWVLSGSHEISFFPLKLLVSLGGEIGVTIFFLISGFGLFCSLDRYEQNYIYFMKRRFVRVAPEYYVFLLFLLFFTPSVGYISFAGLKDVLLHMLFLHNITPQTSGTINGVLWTMAVTVQFYLIAKPMYKSIRKFPVVTLLAGVLFTVSTKYVCFHYLMKHFYVDQPFWYSRNIFFSVIDNFVIGMYVAYLSKKIKVKNKLSIIGICLFIVLAYMVACNGVKFGIHTDNVSGYLWHSLMALCLGGIIFFFQLLDFETNNFIMKLILFISKYEYGIYIVHLVLMLNLLQGSEIIQFIQTKSVLLLYLFLVFLSVVFGIFYSGLVEGIRKVLFSK